MLLMGEQAQNQDENRNLLSDIPTPALKVLFFNAGVLAGVKESCKIALTPYQH